MERNILRYWDLFGPNFQMYCSAPIDKLHFTSPRTNPQFGGPNVPLKHMSIRLRRKSWGKGYSLQRWAESQGVRDPANKVYETRFHSNQDEISVCIFTDLGLRNLDLAKKKMITKFTLIGIFFLSLFCLSQHLILGRTQKANANSPPKINKLCFGIKQGTAGPSMSHLSKGLCS